MMKQSLKTLILIVLGMGCLAVPSFAGMSDYSAVPPFVTGGADTNVLLNLSIETPMQGAAYNDQPNDANNDGDFSDPLDCGGRVNDGGTVGRCYFKEQEYLGIFDANKCYDYSAGRFVPSAAANSDHECSGKWSGNFLNWATMTAIDEFRWALTGGNRVVDTTLETVVERANMALGKGDSWYPVKMIKGIGTYCNVAPNTVTPYGDNRIYIYNHGYQFDVGTSWGGHEKAQNLNVRAKVCDPAQGLEKNCVDYGGYYKPNGLIQNNADQMRFAVMAYALDNSHGRHGGVLRANMKYVGPILPSGANNPKKEFGTNGIFIPNPEAAAEGNSGVINYLNKFGANGYKSYDPISELYYECINYYKNRGPTFEYYNGLTAVMKDGFPVITAWDDPIQYWCQKNYIVGINDANPWNDKKLPGTYFTNGTFNGITLDDSGSGYDWGEPSNADADYSVRDLTNIVGDLQGLTNTSQCIGCTTVSCDMNSTNKNIPGLGEVMGTCPYPSKENSYYIAGLAYYANSQDIRSAINHRQSVSTFMIDTQEYSSNPLTGEMNMLWLAGKYGGFEEKDFQDTNADGNTYEPNLASEWDADSDGEPDNYVLATEPKKLVDGLTKVFSNILKRASSGTAASVISNTRTGEGAVYQSIFYPYYNDSDCHNAVTREVSWVGDVHALFVDSYGNMREDSNGNGALESTTDQIIIFQGTDVYKYTDTDGNDILEPGEFVDTNGNGKLDPSELAGAPFTLADINYVWSSNEWLNHSALVPETQRSAYNANERRRYIFTFIDDGDMVAEAGEQVAFTTAAGDLAKISPYLHLFEPFNYSAVTPPPGIASADFATFLGRQAERVVKYVRGQDQGADAFSSSIIPAMMSRQVDWNCDIAAETWRLGDVIHSTPTVVSRPAEDYDLLYKDASYGAFYKKYMNRRSVVYVGANDGMLHAFNAGFFNQQTKSFNLTGPGGTETPFPLGAELWAYIPFNLLPHLYWLTDPNYSHVYYVDQKPKIFDARIFTPDATHTQGWGTLLVVGMRLGGGAIRTDKNHDGVYDPASDQEMRSAYFILDITDPEAPPKVLAEITFSDLGFTTSYPTAIVMDPKDTVSGNKWYLVLGSGPIDATGPGTTAMKNATSNQQAKIYIINLNEIAAATPTLKNQAGLSLPAAGAFQTLPDTTSYISDLITVDLDLDYRSNAVYFGTISGSFPNWGGKMRRIEINDDFDPANWVGDSTLIDVNKPITAPPALALDDDLRIWLYFGTGRFVNRDDINYVATQTYYGIKEPWGDTNSNGIVDAGETLTWGTVNPATLLDVSAAVVFQTGEDVTGVAATDVDSNGKISFDETISEIQGKNGWYMNFVTNGERNLGQATVFGDIVTFTTYIPESDPCEYEGSSNLYALYYKTGTAYTKSVIGLGTSQVDGNLDVLKMMSLGDGLTITPNIHTGSEEGSKAFIQTSTGAIEIVQQDNPGVIKSGDVSWQEEE